ncbi:MAG: rod shape-determining protein MreD [Nitrospirae bacterium]|nr:rod shape-determining protein MreD [Nitrospirota bacterium]
MKRWVYFILVLALVPVQTTWAHGIRLHDVKPDLGLLLVYFIGFYAGELDGLVMGLAAGALLDLFSGGPWGLNLVTKAILGVLAGVLGRFFLNTTGIPTMGMIFALSVLSGILVHGFDQLMMGGIRFGEALRWTLLPEALYNAALGGILFWAGIGRLRSQKERAVA